MSMEIRKQEYPPGKIPPIPFNEMEPGDTVLFTVKTNKDFNTVKQRVYRKNKTTNGFFSCFKNKEDGLIVVSIYRKE
jgi:hypothetical protein